MPRYSVRRLEFNLGSNTLTAYFFAEPAAASVCETSCAQDGACIVWHNVSQQKIPWTSSYRISDHDQKLRRWRLSCFNLADHRFGAFGLFG